MVVDQLPSPLQLTSERVEKLMCSSAKTFDSFPRQTQQLKEGLSVWTPLFIPLSVCLSVWTPPVHPFVCLSDGPFCPFLCLSLCLQVPATPRIGKLFSYSTDFTACSPDSSAPTVVFISKLFMVDRSSLPQHRARYPLAMFPGLHAQLFLRPAFVACNTKSWVWRPGNKARYPLSLR